MRTALCSALLCMVMLAGRGGSAPAGDTTNVVFVVSLANHVFAITSIDAKRAFTGELTKWHDGKPVIPVLTAPGTPEAEAFLKNILHMGETEYRRALMQLAFAGKEFSQPKRLPTGVDVREFVGANPGAIGCIRASDTGTNVRLLKLDGAVPGDANYKLKLVK